MKVGGVYSDVAIIGNGFDLNLGFKTSYNNFIKSQYFTDLLNADNFLSSYLSTRHNLKNWIDIEEELIQYSTNSISPEALENFEKEFNELQKSLTLYLKSIDIMNIDENSHGYKLIQKIKDENFLILDYNYTGITKAVLKHLGLVEEETTTRLIKVHGSIEEGEIILGVQDDADIKPDHVFLRKGYPKKYKAINVDYQLGQLKNLYIFGHSLGSTDHSYFGSFFLGQSLPVNHNYGKNIYLYYFGDSSYKDLHVQLDIMTQRKLSSFKQINEFNSIDTSA